MENSEHTNSEKVIVGAGAVAGGVAGAAAGASALTSIAGTFGGGAMLTALGVASAPLSIGILGAVAVGTGVSKLIKWFNE